MRLSRFVQSGVAVVAVMAGLMTAMAEVSIASPPATVPAAVPPGPVVSKLSVTSGPVAGGTRITVTGRYFTKVTRVVFGSSAGKSLKVLSATKLQVTAPGHPAGPVNVKVVAKAGTSKADPSDRFTYIAAPVISKVSPAQGSTVGFTQVTITGSNFIRVTKVTFGGKPATIIAASPGSLSVTAPAGTAGQVDIRVSTAYGTSAAVTADHYTYVAPPAVTGISPGTGPAAGGSQVTITGTGFTGATHVTFGPAPAQGYTVNSATSITAVTPPGSGTQDVQVHTPYGTSAAVTADRYQYVAPPVVTGISPATGPAAGGTTVAITALGLPGRRM